MQDIENILESALDCFQEPLFILDQERDCVFANKALYSFLKLPLELRVPLKTADFWPQAKTIDLSLREMSADFIITDGEGFVVKLALSDLALEDTEERYRLVRVLAGLSRNQNLLSFQSQRLETLGMLAGGIAHDFNNVLAGILGHVTYLKTILATSGNHVESLIAIEEGAKKASQITQQILNFSKMDPRSKPKRVNLGDLIVKTCRLLRGAISPQYRIEYQICEEQLCALGVEGSLAQVVVNLVINARDALSQDGFIRIKLEPVNDLEALKVILKSQELSAPAYGCVIVEDNGHGMPKEVQDRIFEPYFTTKKEKGTGLGMATVLSIVEHFGGVVTIDSEVGKGTRIAIYLPLLVKQDIGALSAEVEREPLRLRGGDENILVVDDEFPVRNVLAVSLQHLGYNVETASSGLEALEKFTDKPDHYNLLILDMLMPNMSGDKVFAKMRAIDPELRVLVISGYSHAEQLEKVLKNPGVDFIQKPFTIEDLSRKVRTSLDFDFEPNAGTMSGIEGQPKG